MASILPTAPLQLFTSTSPSDSSAREWAEQELAKSKYHEEPSLWARIIEWLDEHLVITINDISSASTAVILATILAAILAAIIVVLLVKYLRARANSAKQAQLKPIAPLFDDTRSAEQLFIAAEQARRDGDIKTLIVENFRGAIRLLDEHQAIIVRPGLTATEAARQGSEVLGQRDLFLQAAGAFNRVYFSTISATDTDVVAVDKLVAFVRSALLTHKAAVQGSAEGGKP